MKFMMIIIIVMCLHRPQAASLQKSLCPHGTKLRTVKCQVCMSAFLLDGYVLHGGLISKYRKFMNKKRAVLLARIQNLLSVYNDFRIKMGSNESHFNVLLCRAKSQDNVHKPPPEGRPGMSVSGISGLSV